MTDQKEVSTGSVTFGNNHPITIIAGPCQMESHAHAMEMAEALSKICSKHDVGFVYKSSFDKANRTSLNARRGMGLVKSLPVFADIKETYGCPVLTDIHTEEQIPLVAEFVDIMQIPAFLCRQTDLLIAAARSGKVVNIKKGQFLAPWDMANVAKKVAESGNEQILLTDRGTSFGYNTLVSDMRSFPIMAETGYPVIVDATHSIQQPGGLDGASGGQREFAKIIARAAVAVGVAGVFIETHQDPDNAPSDGPCMVHLSDIESLIVQLKAIDSIIKK
ncbi:MAG: 3-deoxy-8-phosphooctulonate synthase [Rickettsiales bacterium]|nr:3-deoxy-8-phosphooctulonate synthase [Rickettsiales bacterium]